jgi:transcriptional regulator with XRE-family HTH domain
VGQRIRRVRRQQQLSLREVDHLSNREFKASVLGAYERGDRVISVLRLQRLAELYRVPVDQLLPRGRSAGAETAAVRPASSAPRPGRRAVRIDLPGLESLTTPEAQTLRRYARMIQLERDDFAPRLTIRGQDLGALGRVFELDERGMRARLVRLGLIDDAVGT